MDWADIQRNPTKRVLMQFGVAATAILLLFAVKRPPFIAIAIACLAVALLRPSLLRVPYVALSVITFPVAWVVSRLVLAAIFYGVVTPIAFALRLVGRDVLRRKQPDVDSYYSARTQPSDLRSYMRQF